jgi:CubicO group peptidase (beta-lactamase class C family)
MTRLRIALLTVLVAASVLDAQVSPAPMPPGFDFSPVEKAVADDLRSSGTPGGAVAIVQGDRVIYSRGFGVASVETNEPVRPEMLFRLGSTTKMFTAAALVALAEQGKLDLTRRSAPTSAA